MRSSYNLWSFILESAETAPTPFSSGGTKYNSIHWLLRSVCHVCLSSGEPTWSALCELRRTRKLLAATTHPSRHPPWYCFSSDRITYIISCIIPTYFSVLFWFDFHLSSCEERCASNSAAYSKFVTLITLGLNPLSGPCTVSRGPRSGVDFPAPSPS